MKDIKVTCYEYKELSPEAKRNAVLNSKYLVSIGGADLDLRYEVTENAAREFLAHAFGGKACEMDDIDLENDGVVQVSYVPTPDGRSNRLEVNGDFSFVDGPLAELSTASLKIRTEPGYECKVSFESEAEGTRPSVGQAALLKYLQTACATAVTIAWTTFNDFRDRAVIAVLEGRDVWFTEEGKVIPANMLLQDELDQSSAYLPS